MALISINGAFAAARLHQLILMESLPNERLLPEAWAKDEARRGKAQVPDASCSNSIRSLSSATTRSFKSPADKSESSLTAAAVGPARVPVLCGEAMHICLIADENALDVHELADAEMGAFPAIAGMLHPAKGHPRIGAHIVIHEAHASFEHLRRDALAPGDV
jgi:hypothetical protein